MAKDFFHDDRKVDQEFLGLGGSVDDLEAINAGVQQHTATPGGPVGTTIPKRRFWTVGTSTVGGPDEIS